MIERRVEAWVRFGRITTAQKQHFAIACAICFFFADYDEDSVVVEINNNNDGNEHDDDNVMFVWVYRVQLCLFTCSMYEGQAHTFARAYHWQQKNWMKRFFSFLFGMVFV